MILATILRDTRERRPWEFQGYPVETADVMLSTGDYTVAEFCNHDGESDTYDPRFAIERKSGHDFLNSITSDRERFEAEIARASEWPMPLYVVVEESWRTFAQNRDLMDHRRVHPNQVEGTVSAWSRHYNVEFHFVPTRRAAELYAFCSLLSHWPIASEKRMEPDLEIYSDALLLVDALQRHDPTALADLTTDALVTLYTLLSDVQRNANEFRTGVADVLLDRLPNDGPLRGSYGSVQRTTRRDRSLKDETEVLETLEEAGIDRDLVIGVDRDSVDDVLEVTELAESDVYEIEESEYVRKAGVDRDVKETRLQGVKERRFATNGDEAEELRREIEKGVE